MSACSFSAFRKLFSTHIFRNLFYFTESHYTQMPAGGGSRGGGGGHMGGGGSFGGSRGGFGGGGRVGGYGNYNMNVKGIAGAGAITPRSPANRGSSVGRVSGDMKVNGIPPLNPVTRAKSPLQTGGYLNNRNDGIRHPRENGKYYYPSQNLKGRYPYGYGGRWRNRYPYGYYNNGNMANYNGSYPWYSYYWYPWYNWLYPSVDYSAGDTYIINNDGGGDVDDDYSNESAMRYYEMQEGFARTNDMYFVMFLVAIIITFLLVWSK